LSMSMSMSTSPEGRDASISVPFVTDAPSAPFRTERLIPCSGTVSTLVSMSLEVELVVGKTDFTGDLEQALTAALLDGSYTMCDPRRRLAEKTDLHQRKRSLQASILLSPVVVTATQQSCITTDSSATSCRVATAEMQAFGTDNSQSIVTSVDSITKDDVFFDTILKTKGIVAVRVIQQTNRGSNVEASNAATSSTLEPTVRSSQTIMAVVLSVAALTLVVAVIVRRGATRKRHLWYGPTVEETYDENQCLGIQPRESFENTSDVDTLYSPKAEHPHAASF
jgi:hypothetical protein